MQFDNPLIVQGDRTLLLDVHAPLANECRNDLIPFAELERSPEHLHTYRLTPLSLWNATSAGLTPDDAVAVLEKYARYDVPQNITMWIKETASRFGKLRLIPGPVIQVPVKTAEVLKAHVGVDSVHTVEEQYLYLVANARNVYLEIKANPHAKKLLEPCEYAPDEIKNPVELTEEEKQYCFRLKLTDRGTIKQVLLNSLWPVKDEVQLEDGEPLDFNLREETSAGKPFEIRGYQKNAAQALVGNKGPGTGFGTIVLPCGAGKTIVGMTVMDLLKTSTLIITTNISAVHQWIQELKDKSNLTDEQIAEYTGENKTLAPVTVATYQILTWRPEKDGPYPHFSIFTKRKWGLIIYDEVHMLPAPVFRVVAELQAVRRVGLTATLVREDGCEGYVFSLVGPKRYDVPWKELEKAHWIAKAECIEVRLDLPESQEIEYAVASAREKHKLASVNEIKNIVTQKIIARYPDDKILVIGQYLDQLNTIAKELNAPIITGKTPNVERDQIYKSFREGKIHVLVVSKVANFAIDLPDASIAIQISGTFGSRQEEAQRLGRILRPKERTSRFFTLITRNTVEEDFGSNRQKFLAEQGYSYKILRYTQESDLNELENN
ncbi:MAG: DNA repair helicase XPB [Treponema sp.]|nr:DEAD/DEAH box helicase [Spirochaetia bacterium]MDY4767456.1 DNA repair helicase XPB [Treponema sp.]